MANIKSAEKRAKQSTVRRARNAGVTTALKTSQKKARAAVEGGDTVAASARLAEFSAALDKAAKRGIIHKNKANRHKSQFNKALKGMQTA
jgi:small subunit ribosomal protein S20